MAQEIICFAMILFRNKRSARDILDKMPSEGFSKT